MDTRVEALRVCTRCNESKPISQYHVRNALKGTHQRICKACIKVYSTHYCNKFRDRLREKDRARWIDGRGSRSGSQKARRKSWGTRGEGRRAWLDALKSENPCMDCGGKFPPECMDLDHVRGEKMFHLSNASSRTISDDLALEEIQKCDLVCSNCHRVRTKRRWHEARAAKAERKTHKPRTTRSL